MIKYNKALNLCWDCELQLNELNSCIKPIREIFCRFLNRIEESLEYSTNVENNIPATWSG